MKTLKEVDERPATLTLNLSDNASIEDLRQYVPKYISKRTFAYLSATGMQEVGEIRGKTDVELLQYPNIGRKSLNQIRVVTERRKR